MSHQEIDAADEVDYDREPQTVDGLSCPTCYGTEATLLGTLGRLTWYRCRACGTDFGDHDPSEFDTSR